MIRYLICTAALVAFPVTVTAQDAAYDQNATTSCLADAGTIVERRACIGLSADACADASVGGFNTRSMTACLKFEYDLFDDMLNAEYGIVHDLAQDLDKQDNGNSFDDVSMVDRLVQMQRAWIAYRDATCAYEQRQFDGGTLGQLVHIDCLTQLTAEQTFRLQSTALGL